MERDNHSPGNSDGLERIREQLVALYPDITEVDALAIQQAISDIDVHGRKIAIERLRSGASLRSINKELGAPDGHAESVIEWGIRDLARSIRSRRR